MLTTARSDDQDKNSGSNSFFPILIDSDKNSTIGLSKNETKEVEI